MAQSPRLAERLLAKSKRAAKAARAAALSNRPRKAQALWAKAASLASGAYQVAAPLGLASRFA